MFDLEIAIVDWRKAQEALPASVLAELEEHLRSSVDDLSNTGLSTDEAFLIARRRLGSPAELVGEFAKVPGAGAERRVRWLMAGLMSLTLLVGAVVLLARRSQAAA